MTTTPTRNWPRSSWNRSATKLKSQPATRDIPIILCSVSRGRCILAEKSAREAVDFLHKTLQREVLQARISRVLDR